MTTDDRAHESTVGLLGGLITDAKDLAVAHLDGVRAEVKEEFRDLKVSTAYAGAAMAVFSVGSLLAAFAIVHAVWTYTRLPQWAAYAVIAALCFVAGAVLLAVRKRTSQDVDLVPETGLAGLRDDAKWVAERARQAV
jgi:hypothetical protein